jgi:hypothetical protein
MLIFSPQNHLKLYETPAGTVLRLVSHITPKHLQITAVIDLKQVFFYFLSTAFKKSLKKS